MIEEEEDKDILNSSVVKTINNYLIDYFSFIVVYVVVITVAVGYFYLLSPKYKKIIANNKMYQNAKQLEKDQLNRAVENYQKYQTVYMGIPDIDKERINTFLPDYNDSEELLIYARNMMNRGGYKLLAVNLGLATDKETRVANGSMIKKIIENPESDIAVAADELGTIDIDLKVGEVNYGTIKKLLSFIERDARFFDIVHVDFSLANRTADLKLKAYYLK